MWTNDSLRTLASGLGDPSRDKAATVYYSHTWLSDDQLVAMYTGSGLARKIVNIPAADALRKGRDWQAEGDDIEAIEVEEKRLGLWPKLIDGKVKARLFGGAAVYIGTRDQDPRTPLEVNRIGKGGVTHLTVMTRRECTAGALDRNAFSATYGRPAYYQVNGADVLAEIHPSRLVIFTGDPHPDPFLAVGVNAGWGEPVLKAVLAELNNANATAANIASLVFEANVDVFKIPDLMRNVADDQWRRDLIERFGLAAAVKGINKALIIDALEEYERKQISFATLPDVLQEFMVLLAAVADIPVTRLFGRSPAGMNATGESDMKNYHDRVQSSQTLEIGPAIAILDECLIRSALGDCPADIYYEWAPLEQMSEKEQSEIGKNIADAVKTYADSGLFPPPALAQGAANRIIEDGLLPGFETALDDAGGLDAVEPEETEPTDPREPLVDHRFTDATPRTLYVRRDVKNADAIRRWARGQGLEPQDGLHVTIAYSRTPLDWMKVSEPWDGELRIVPGGPRVMERFDGGALVLAFKSRELEWRHSAIVDAGATDDYDEYQPHVTIAYLAPDDVTDLSEIEPYRGEIILGPEIFEEIEP